MASPGTINRTRAVEVSIHAVAPESMAGSWPAACASVHRNNAKSVVPATTSPFFDNLFIFNPILLLLHLGVKPQLSRRQSKSLLSNSHAKITIYSPNVSMSLSNKGLYVYAIRFHLF